MVSRFIKRFKWDILIGLLLLCFTPFFFYKLGQSSLVSWDEAWYATIAKNIVNSGNFLQLWWNGNYFYDHPPAGFWWIALSFKFIGVDNFAARLPSAIFGIGTLLSLHFLGKEFFNRWVGLAASIALVSAPWFLFRSRSGDLDIFLTFFFVTSFLLAAKSVKNAKYTLPLGVSLGFLFLTKTIVPLTIIPALVIIFWKSKYKKYKLGIATFLFFFFTWFIAQLFTGLTFTSRYFRIGLTGVSAKTSLINNFWLLRNYLHSGIGKWFWPGAFSIIANFVWRKREFVIISVFCISFLLPFLFSPKTQIWHLIPIFPFLLLALFSCGFSAGLFVSKSRVLAGIAILIFALYFSFLQLRSNWYLFIDIPSYISDEEILSREAGKYSGRLYVDGDFVPSAAFYSDKDNVEKTCVGKIAEIFKNETNFLLITTIPRLNQEGVTDKSYEILASDRDKVLVRKI